VAKQVAINGGARLTGTIGRTEFGFMDVDTRSSGPNPYANYAVARLKESLWAGSYIGVMGSISSPVIRWIASIERAALIPVFVFFKDWFVDAHMAGTQSPGHPSGNSDRGASLSYRSTGWKESLSAEKSARTSIPRWDSSNSPTPMKLMET